MATRIIGIDFGTSTTVVRVHNLGSENRIVPLTVNGLTTIPTIAFQQQDSLEMYYGYNAEGERRRNAKGILYENFKMDLISNDETKRKFAEKLTQGFLRYLYERYQEQQNKGVFDPADEVKVYISHPAKWPSRVRALMKQCVVNAGFCNEENVDLKDEPTAAMLAVIHENITELKQKGMLNEHQKYKAMMVDMGAGTTDIVLCTYCIENGRVEIRDIFTFPSTNTPGLCGGREIDEAIISEVEQFVTGMTGGISSPIGGRVVSRLRDSVKTWKEQEISPCLRENKDIPEPEAISSYRANMEFYGERVVNSGDRFSLSRKWFETFTKNHWEQWVNLLNGAFDEVVNVQYKDLECPKKPEEVELLLITGGHSKWYVVPEFLLGEIEYRALPTINFEKIRESPFKLVQSNDPQETVAVGLCHLGEDVVGAIPMSNDVSVSFTCEGKYLGACDLIKKGTPLPYVKTDFHETNYIKGNFFFRKEIKIDYVVITDKKNSIKTSITVPADSILLALLKIVLGGIVGGAFDVCKFCWFFIRGELNQFDSTVINLIKNHDYKAVLSPYINVNNEGIINVCGKIEVDGEKLTIPEIVI